MWYSTAGNLIHGEYILIFCNALSKAIITTCAGISAKPGHVIPPQESNPTHVEI